MHCAIVVPAFNEAEVIPNLVMEITSITRKIAGIEFDIFIVNDGSTDKTWQVINTLVESKKTRVIGINLSRNFGKENAITAGMREAQEYDLVLTMDADLQHPPKLIPEMLNEWKLGAEMVVCIRQSSENSSMFRRLGSRLFHKLMRLISNLDSVQNSTDFRLYDQKVVLELNKLDEKVRLFRGLADWVGFKKSYLEFNAPQRVSGKSTFGFTALFALATASVLSFSLWPLRLTAYAGFFVTAAGVMSLVFMLIDKFTLQYINAGPLALVAVLNLSLSGIVMMAVGVVAIYLGKVNTETIGRPSYIISERRRYFSKSEKN